MGSKKFELSDMSDNKTNLTPPEKKQSGVQISPAVGFILILLASVVAVGVGIIVHFAGGNRDVVCYCKSSAVSEKPSAEAIKEGCLELAAMGDVDVCNKCSAAVTTTYKTDTPGSIPTRTATTAAPTSPATTVKPKVTDVRLPTSLYPLHYDVTLQPYMNDSGRGTFTFKGSVKILMRCDVATDNITLHINVLTVDESSVLFSADGSSISPKITGFDNDTDRQFFIVRLGTHLEVSKNYILEMNFTSPLKNDLHGLYYSEYTRGNDTIYLATTLFAPTDARKAFPCFDEPAIKATFNITLIRPYDRISISNMPIIDNSTIFEEDGVTYVKDVYQQTPKMSTYLLAFIVCDFDYTQNITKNNVTYRAWATPESVDQTFYSLQVGVEIIEYFEDYFDVKYPLPKQDMIAIPDFAAGAMENWGLITYRETAMLYKEGVSNEANKERVATVVSHELAHQWFGNLVTLSWWDDLWLNEGFASFVEYLGVDKVHPEWNMFNQFVISDLQNSFKFDGLTSSHPVYVPVAHPDEINEIFDTISYEKGATIIRMMRHFLGEKTFQNGTTNYLRKHSYGAAIHDDLWTAMEQQAASEGKDIQVKNIMDTWTLQMNYPVVTVNYRSPGRLNVSQERYLSDPTAEDPGKYNSTFGYRWSIPLTFTSSISPRFDQNDSDVYWLYQNETNREIDVSESTQLPVNNNPNDWILANIKQYGYYRVNYEVSNWRALSKQLTNNYTVIPIINRAQIINDAWNLAKSGHIGLEIALETIEYLDKERDYVPWYAARTELNFVETMLSFTSVYGQFQSFMKKTLSKTFDHFGLTRVSENHVDVATQSLIAHQACYYGIRSCLDEASAQFGKWMKNKNHNPIDPNLRTVIYCYAIKNGRQEEFNFALDRYNDADVASEKANLLSAMSCTKETWLLSHFMSIILETSSPIRKQDALSVITYVARNNVGRYLAWNFFRSNFAKLREDYGASFFGWSSVIGAVAESFNTDFLLKEVAAFRDSESGNLGTGERAFSQALEKVSSNIKWMNNNLPIITEWLKKKENQA